MEAARGLGEGEIEGCAATDLAGRPDSAAVVLNNMLDDGEAKSRAALLARARLVHSVEPLKDSFEGFRRYPRAVILDEHLDLAAVLRVATNGDGAFGAAIFDAVINQIAQHLLQPVSVSADSEVGGLIDELNALGGRPGLEVFEHLGDDWTQGHGLEAQLDAARLQFGDGEQILDEQPEALGVAVDGLQEFSCHLRVIPGAIEQRLDVAFDEGKGGAQLMADVGDEFLPGALKLLQAGQLVEDENGAMPQPVTIEDGGSVDLQPAFVQPGQLQLVAQALASVSPGN